MKKDSEVLECAAKLLEEYGWWQGAFGSVSQGPHCLVGALWECGGKSETFMANFQPAGYGSPIKWNDTKGRTKEEVIAALLTAAEVARQKESAVGATPSVPDS